MEINSVALQEDLENAWEVLAEAVQTVMRKTGYSNPYEHMKELTRGTGITKDEMREFIRSLDLPPEEKNASSILNQQRILDWLGFLSIIFQSRLKMIEGLSHITFIVSDLGRMSHFLTYIFEVREIYSSGEKRFSTSKEKFFLINGLWFAVMEGKPLAEKTYYMKKWVNKL